MIYVRDLTTKEGNQLKHIIRKGSYPVKVRRAMVILASAQKMTVPHIARLYHMSEDHIRRLIHRFNKEGMKSLHPCHGGGRPRTFTPEQRVDIIELAQIPPKALGMPFTSWSLPKLKEIVEKKRIVRSISIETIRCILDEANITYQHTKTWKESNDPEFHAKKNEPNSSTKTRPKMDG
ncbi:helix-turn-helix domain-containing protein [Paludifilum halophilum]|uniref:helix-turn-helix domain-containing protein n=1 Tax=Paludifilum halophilum TaxID=1642702 RepID=UPI00197FCB83|nr:helix-turn-helix domain-containing protein [Paludifilum halophilum]